MALNQPVFIDSIALNGSSGIEVWITPGGDPYRISEETRSRAGIYPAFDGASKEARRLPILVKRSGGTAATMTAAQFDSHVRGIFQASSRQRTLTAERDGIDYTISARVLSFDRRQGGGAWDGQILLLDPEWSGPLVGPVTTSPLDVQGNADARPVISITNGASALRRRLTLLDQTSQGYASWPVGVDVSADALDSDNYLVYFNGVPTPHWLIDGRLYYRAAGKINEPSFVDILSGADIQNTENDMTGSTAFDEGGLKLAGAIATGSVTVDPEEPWMHPKSAALSWHPGVGGEHSDNRAYTYGFDGDGAIRLIDTENTGRSWSLKNDADSYILSSPVEMAALSDLSIEAFVGFQPGRGSSKSGSRVLKVTIQDANGNISNGPVEENSYVLGLRALAGTERNPNFSHYATFSMGGISFPDTTVAKELVDAPSGLGTFYSGTVYRNDYLPTDFGTLAARYLGCPVTSGGAGVWYLWFDEDAYGGLTIPEPSMSIQPKSGRMVAKTIVQPPAVFVDHQYGSAAIDNVLILNSEWVDPVTKKSLGTGADTTPSQDLYGIGRVVTWYWTRESELPKIAFEQTIVGYADVSTAPAQPNTVITAGEGGLVYTITPPTIPIPGAVKVAVGIAPVASAPDNVDWITARITAPVTLTLDTTQLPSVTQVDVVGQLLNGTLRNLTSGETIRFTDVYSDANGLELDCKRLSIQGVSGSGMVYGEISPSGGVLWFNLPVGDVAWDATGALADASIAFSYTPQLIGNS